MGNTWVITKRELSAYFSTPLAYVFIVIFLALSGAITTAQTDNGAIVAAKTNFLIYFVDDMYVPVLIPFCS